MLNEYALRALLTALFLVHMAGGLFLNGYVYFTTSPLVLALIIVASAAIVLQWYLLGNCFLSRFENMLRPLQYADGADKNMIVQIMSDSLGGGEVTWFYIGSFLPLLTIGVATWRLYRMAAPQKRRRV